MGRIIEEFDNPDKISDAADLVIDDLERIRGSYYESGSKVKRAAVLGANKSYMDSLHDYIESRNFYDSSAEKKMNNIKLFIYNFRLEIEKDPLEFYHRLLAFPIVILDYISPF